MLLSLALLFLCGMAAGALAKQCRLPALMGMLLAGIVLGPHVLNLLDSSLLSISAELRRMALIIILLRAGLNLELADLKQAGRSAVLMCFVPACCEMAGMLLLAPPLLGMNVWEAALLGTVTAAVSPAVVVPKMLKLMDEGYGVEKGVPQMILAGASVDDVFVIVLFNAMTELNAQGSFDAASLLKIPTSILLGLAGGWLCGLAMAWMLRRTKQNAVSQTIVLLSVCFLLSAAENAFSGNVGFSGLLAVMGMGLTLRRQAPDTAKKLSAKYAALWMGGEVLLFVLVGACVDIEYALAAGGVTVLLLAGVLVFRMAGVWLCMLGTRLSLRERLFCMLAYTPKATVQAAIGSIPLAMGLACGNTVLTVAVAAILLTAPLGAFAIDMTYRRLLRRQEAIGNF